MDQNSHLFTVIAYFFKVFTNLAGFILDGVYLNKFEAQAIMRIIQFFLYGLMFVMANLFLSCYSFTGTNLSPDVKTIEISYFPNYASLINPDLSQSLTSDLQNYFQTRTPLDLTNKNGDLRIEGEITNYRVTPTAETGSQSLLNRLTISVKVRYFNRFDADQNFEKTYSDFSNFPRNATLSGRIEENAVQEINEKIAQKIFNDTVANW